MSSLVVRTAVLRLGDDVSSTLSVPPSNCWQWRSHLVLSAVRGDNHVINVSSDRRFGLVNTCQSVGQDRRKHDRRKVVGGTRVAIIPPRMHRMVQFLFLE